MAKQALGRACELARMRTAYGLATGLLAFTPSLAWGATHTYPGAAPCNGTLQACIDGVSAGERIEIASNAPIAEALSIAKSLTLAAAPGYRPQLGGELSPRDLHPLQVAVKEAAGGAATSVTFSQLSFDADITVDLPAARGTRSSSTAAPSSATWRTWRPRRPSFPARPRATSPTTRS